MKTALLLALVLCYSGLLAQQYYYDVTAGNGYGIRFWGSDNYKIHMGNTAEYTYGPVTGYSIKMNMHNTPGRGWTWGVVGLNPIAAIGINGDMQIEGSFVTLGSLGIGTFSPNAALQFGNALSKSKIVLYEELNNDHDFYGFGVISGVGLTYQIGSPSNSHVFYAGASAGIGMEETNDARGFRLAVAGTAVAEEVVVQLEANWPDYVFDAHYKIPSLSQLEQFIKANKHLPDVPTAEDVEENGLSLGEMNAVLLKKVEELTLYLIEQNRINDQQKLEINFLKNKVRKLQNHQRTSID